MKKFLTTLLPLILFLSFTSDLNAQEYRLTREQAESLAKEMREEEAQRKKELEEYPEPEKSGRFVPLEDYEEMIIEWYGEKPSFNYAKRIISNHLKENEPLWSDLRWDRWYTNEDTEIAHQKTRPNYCYKITDGGYKFRVVYTIRSTVFDKIFFISHQKVIEERNFKLPEKY